MNQGGLNLQKNISLHRHTTFRIGGPADFFIKVRSIRKLIKAIQFTDREKMPFIVIGSGSNLLICDRGVRGLVIKNNIRGIRRVGDSLIVKSGEKLSAVVETAKDQCLTGLEFASGIPGSIGGAIYGNAGAFGRAIGDLVTAARLIDKKGNILDVKPDFFQFKYRWSRLKEVDHILLEVTLELEPGCRDEIFCEMDRIMSERKKKHPTKEWGCAGSFFKNIDPKKPGERRIAAGELLDKVGAKGMTLGRAKVFPGHANFITNSGGATCEEIFKLAEILKKRVKERFGIELEEEVIYVGEHLDVRKKKSQSQL